MGPAFVTRFAPSPTGHLHLGHAFSALTAFDAAMAAGGRFLLRIEDIDSGRCRPEFEAAIYEDLAWLGVVWAPPVIRQSERTPTYQSALARLIDTGLVYRCFATRREIALSAPHGADPAPFFGAPLPAAEEARRLAAGEGFAWRLDVRAAAPGDGDAALLGDIALARKDAPASYHLASVVDDGESGVTHVIRGEDLRAAAGPHRVLQRLLGLTTPEYRHHRLILGPDGKRLAKRDQSTTLRALKALGETPEMIRARLGLCNGS